MRRRAPRAALRLSAPATLFVLLAALTGAAPAFAEAPSVPHWRLESRSAPTNLPLAGEGMVLATAANLGDAEVNGAQSTVTLTDTLPEHIEVTSVEGGGTGTSTSQELPCATVGRVVTCTFTSGLATFGQLEIKIRVKTSFGAPAEPENEVTVSGGGAPSAEMRRALKVNGEKTTFGVESFEATPENEEFGYDDEAGSHPFQLTTTLTFNETFAPDPGPPSPPPLPVPSAPALLKNLSVKLPPGLVGNANVVGNPDLPQQCPDASFGSNGAEGTNACPADTAVGVAAVTFNDEILLKYDTFLVPVFNLVPAPGEPAKFGIDFNHVPIVLDTSVRTGEEYGVTVSVHDASQSVQVLSTRVTIWGVPGDERHMSARGWECISYRSYVKEFIPERPCVSLNLPGPAQPFLLLPTSCEKQGTTEPELLRTTVSGEAWNGQPITGDTEYSSKALTGCGELPFTPSIGVSPGWENESGSEKAPQHAASTPTGMTVKVHLPQNTTLEAEGKAEADVRSTTLELPPELQASAGAANLLEACSAGQIGWNAAGNGGFNGNLAESTQLENNDFSPTLPEPTKTLPEPPCPQLSKVGSVDIKTPLLKEDVRGGVYLAEQDTNPFASPLVLYIIAQEPTSKVLVKLAGEVAINQTTGQLVSTFKNTPQVPFETLTLHLFNGQHNDGERSTQATPARCGEYHATAAFENWSTAAVTKAESNPAEFQITSGPNGTECPGAGATLPFGPRFTAGEEDTQAGAFTPFNLTIFRPDGDQALTGLTVHLPQGAAAMLSSVTPCPIAQADAGTCGPESRVGESMTSSGLGGEPLTLPGEVFLTEGFDGAPFGVSVKTNAERVGPFNVGTIIANSTIRVDPNTAAATIAVVETRILESDGQTTVLGALPTMIKGVPVQLKQVSVTVNRPGFEFNPTNCGQTSISGSPMDVTGSLGGSEGASVPVASKYGVINCGALPFAPTLTASASGHGSKADGTAFSVKVTSSPGQANIAKTFLTIPAALPSRLTTIQQACPAATFEANPATCDEGSNIGFAVAHTPVLKKPLEGPAYLVSHGNAAFPDVEFVLQGEGITLVLDGKTNIKSGVTYSRFESVPDAPVSTFETVLPAGPHSALTANVPEKENFSLCKTPVAMPTEITAQNGAVIKQTTKVAITGCSGVLGVKYTRSQLLAKALKACRKHKNKKKRLACEKQARKKYGPKKAAKKKKK